MGQTERVRVGEIKYIERGDIQERESESEKGETRGRAREGGIMCSLWIPGTSRGVTNQWLGC